MPRAAPKPAPYCTAPAVKAARGITAPKPAAYRNVPATKAASSHVARALRAAPSLPVQTSYRGAPAAETSPLQYVPVVVYDPYAPDPSHVTTYSLPPDRPAPEWNPRPTNPLSIIPKHPRPTVLTVTEKLDLLVKIGNVGFRCEGKRGNCKQCNFCVYKQLKTMEMAQQKKGFQQMYQQEQ